MTQQQVVLISGVSSGIGLVTARFLAKRGYTVFGTARRPCSLKEGSNIKVLTLDVRSEESVQECVNTVINLAGRLDVLINNAGYALAGAIEETPTEQAKAQFETNFFGAARMVRAVLPVMRHQQSGRIINISSLAGRVALPFLGYYSATKFALEGYSEALRHELKPFGITVSLVEPGFIRTRIGHNLEFASSQIACYAPWRKRGLATTKRELEQAPDPARVANTIVRIIESPRPRLRYPVGQGATLLLGLNCLLPASVFEQTMRRRLQLDAVGTTALTP